MNYERELDECFNALYTSKVKMKIEKVHKICQHQVEQILGILKFMEFAPIRILKVLTFSFKEVVQICICMSTKFIILNKFRQKSYLLLNVKGYF